jgi:hypothetical protein
VLLGGEHIQPRGLRLVQEDEETAQSSPHGTPAKRAFGNTLASQSILCRGTVS